MTGTIKLPDFIICGAPKCGTSTLMHALAKHPEIYMSCPKEPHFFDVESNYERGPGWYSTFFKDRTGEKLAGEKTPEYMCYENVPERMVRVVPEARLIFLLRNPVDRAYSAYWHAVRYGRESLSFAKAVATEPERISRDPLAYRHNSYVLRGNYFQQINWFLKHFDRSRVLILIFEEYVKNPAGTLAEVTEFLGVGCNGEFLADAQSERRNVAKMPRSTKLQKLFPFLRERFFLGARLLRKLNLKEGDYPPMPEELRVRLSGQFRESNKELEGMLGRRLDVWKGGGSS